MLRHSTEYLGGTCQNSDLWRYNTMHVEIEHIKNAQRAPSVDFIP